MKSSAAGSWNRQIYLAHIIPLIMPFVMIQIALGQTDFWPMHGHDAQRTNRSSVSGPTKPSLKWSYDFAATRLQDNACPIVGPDGTVYQPTESGFYALNADGSLKWSTSISTMRLAPALSPDGETVYTVDAFNSVKALDAQNGNILWRYGIVGDVTYSSFVVDDNGTIYLGTRHPSSIYAFNPDSTLKWLHTEPGSDSYGIEAPLSIDFSGNLYVMSNYSGFLSLDSSGTKRWSRGDMGAMASWPTFTVGNSGTLYFPGEPSYNMYGADAFNPDSSIKWSLDETISPGPGYLAGVTISSDDSTVYLRNGHNVFAVEASTGTVRWSAGIPGTFDAFGGSPALSGNGILYMVSDYGEIYAISTLDGLLLWQYELNTGPVYWGPQSPAFGPDGTLYVVSSGDYGYAGGTTPARLYAFYADDFLAPVLQSPSDDSTHVPVTVTLRWHQTIDAVTYRLQIATDTNFNVIILDDSTLTTTSRDVGPLSKGTTYSWRVRSKNGSDTAWSTTWNFSTVPINLYSLIDPDGDGGFETAETFGGNGWMEANGTQMNKWCIGTAAKNGGVRSAYISNDGGVSNFYLTSSTSVVHLYRAVTFAADDSNLTLKFDWKGQGENNYDYMQVFLVDGATTPAAGTALTTGQIGAAQYKLQSTYASVTMAIDSSNRGTTKKLVFSWKNDFGFGTQPPVSIDNISLTSESTAPLSVELLSFAATVKAGRVELRWTTAVELNNSGFEVEKSSTGIHEWKKIGFVQGNGTSNAPHEFVFNDNYPADRKCLYRLKQIDMDGSFTYSAIIEADKDPTPKVFSLEQNFPNPFNLLTTIEYQLPEAAETKLTIADVLGRDVAVLVNEKKDVGHHWVRWDAAKFSSGIYICTLTVGARRASRRMILLK